jgi:DNA mismatch repair protein MutL
MYESLAKQLSCKKSIKANSSILDIEVNELLQNLKSCKMPYTCPHGRPTLVKISTYEIEKMFKRVI